MTSLCCQQGNIWVIDCRHRLSTDWSQIMSNIFGAVGTLLTLLSVIVSNWLTPPSSFFRDFQYKANPATPLCQLFSSYGRPLLSLCYHVARPIFLEFLKAQIHILAKFHLVCAKFWLLNAKFTPLLNLYFLKKFFCVFCFGFFLHFFAK